MYSLGYVEKWVNAYVPYMICYVIANGICYLPLRRRNRRSSRATAGGHDGDASPTFALRMRGSRYEMSVSLARFGLVDTVSLSVSASHFSSSSVSATVTVSAALSVFVVTALPGAWCRPIF